jgi:hypothetical protein
VLQHHSQCLLPNETNVSQFIRALRTHAILRGIVLVVERTRSMQAAKEELDDEKYISCNSCDPSYRSRYDHTESTGACFEDVSVPA